MRVEAIIATFMLAVQPATARYCGEGWIECNCNSTTTDGSAPPAAPTASVAAAVLTRMTVMEGYQDPSVLSIPRLEEAERTDDALGPATLLLHTVTIRPAAVFGDT
ncbi:hypothetical protein F53441_10461 [Fusarium austroafricanum]|uniref:Uncharacterized protein n=1 Tax=Fusarium austroafricanum TaxID=2364996 RepID=A0A8H4NVC8_9HYPO|nr:hypothetical protein F53441_10461 [Fusarium austroafricanum]